MQGAAQQGFAKAAGATTRRASKSSFFKSAGDWMFSIYMISAFDVERILDCFTDAKIRMISRKGLTSIAEYITRIPVFPKTFRNLAAK